MTHATHILWHAAGQPPMITDAEYDAFVDSLWDAERDRLDAQSMAAEDHALEESDYDAHSWQWLPGSGW